jgi:hypothetical protein
LQWDYRTSLSDQVDLLPTIMARYSSGRPGVFWIHDREGARNDGHKVDTHSPRRNCGAFRIAGASGDIGDPLGVPGLPDRPPIRFMYFFS